MTRLEVTTGKTSLRRSAPHPRTRAARDLVADWKRWTLAERIIVAAFVAVVALTVLAISTGLASGGH
jgi:hypothetical protein